MENYTRKERIEAVADSVAYGIIEGHENIRAAFDHAVISINSIHDIKTHDLSFDEVAPIAEKMVFEWMEENYYDFDNLNKVIDFMSLFVNDNDYDKKATDFFFKYLVD